MQLFSFSTTKSIRFGCGALDQIGVLSCSMMPGRVLVLTDPGMMKTDIVGRALALLRKSSVEVELFDRVEADPPAHIILEATDMAKACGATGIIGIGGGSSLDVAKIVAVLAGGKENLADIYGINNVKGPRLPLLLVPTTSGTGSEVTPISIVTTGTNQKMGVVSPVLIPDLALLDPELTYGLPAHVTAATGVDAMVHAIEAYASINPNNNPISKLLAKEALALMAPSLETAVQDGSNKKARYNMMLGSMFAGQAFANSPVAAVHALAYPLGGHFHIAHGLSNALVLPHVLRFNVEHVSEPYVELAPSAFPELTRLDGPERALAFCNALENLSTRCALPKRLRDVGIPKEALVKLASDVMNQSRLLGNNPRTISESDALAIYQAAW